MHSRRSQASAHSAAGRRCTQRTAEVQRRQLRHPSETRCQRRCPIISELILIACTDHRPSARPSQNPHHPLQPQAQSPQPAASSNAQPALASIRSQRKLSRCTQRTTEVQRRQLRHLCETRCQRRYPSCFDLIACTHRRPSARPSQNPHHPLQPRAQPPQPTARSIIHAQPAFASIRSQRSWPPMHAAYH
jgi:hypothetical protein